MIPSITRFTSPPAWVKLTRRRRTRAIQSIFSTPLSIEILAPAEIGEPFQGTPFSSAKSRAAMIRRHSASASAPETLARIAQKDHASHALWILVCEVPDDANDDIGCVPPVGTIDWNQTAAGIEIILNEVTWRQTSSGMFGIGSEHADDFVWVDESALAHPHDFLLILGQRLYAVATWRRIGRSSARPRRRGWRCGRPCRAIRPFLGLECGRANHLFQAEAVGRPMPAYCTMSIRLIRLKSERRPNVKENAIPVQAFVRPTPRLKQAHGGSGFSKHALQMWQRPRCGRSRRGPA